MINRFLIIALLALSFTGCYTSFSPRDSEEESYGQMNESYYGAPEVAEYIDSSEYYTTEYYDDQPGGVTVINNYAPDWGWGYEPYSYSSFGFYPSYGFYSSYYDPFCTPYYTPYYGGNVFVYGDAYFGGGYYGGISPYPSPVRYRTNTSHWTSLRNTGGRSVSTTRSRGRATVGRRTSESQTRNDFLAVRGVDLDRDLDVSRIASRDGVSRSSATRTRNNNGTRVAKRTTDLERRRISTSRNNSKVVRSNKKSHVQRVTQSKKPTKRVRNRATSQKRSKRVYSSKRSGQSRSSNKSSSSSYYKPSRKSSSSSSSYNSSRSSSPKRSSVSRSSHSSSSRSSVSSSSKSSSRSTSSTSRRRR